MDDLDARPVFFHDEGGDLARVGMLRHDDEELGDRAVGAPELLAVQDVVPFGSPRGGRREVRGVRSHFRLRQREGGDRAAGEAREVFLLLLRRAEKLQRLRNADRLVRG